MELSSGALENIAHNLFNQAADCDARILSSLDQAEHTIELDYRGRYFFELLQNARDAAALESAMARIKVVVRAGELLVANTGSPFNEEGLKSICSLGLSTKKNSKLFIGNKGLGFKAVLEITSKPRIVTKSGTVVFSREKAYAQLMHTGIHQDELPLLFLPMYEPADLSSFPGFEDYSTLLVLPLRAGITAARVLNDILQIKGISYALMRNFEKLEIVDEDKNEVKILQIEYKKEDICQISLTGSNFVQIKLYSHTFTLTGDLWKQLSTDEQKLFPSGSGIEIVIALKFGPQGEFQSFEDVPLYLYYPLEERSGFRFIIHSQFIVTPNRKGLLENSLLNQLILKEILFFINNQFLNRISKEFPTQVSEILTHVPNLSSALHKYNFYTAFHDLICKQPLVWNETAGRLLRTDEFLLVSQEQKNLFTDPIWGNQYLMHIPYSSPTYDYLVKYMNAKTLTPKYISEHIEDYASRQLQHGHIRFFADLYNYAASQKILLAGKKILLTEKNTLVDNRSEVYYGSQRTDVHIPDELAGKIVFLHRTIGLREVRVADRFIGVREYTTEQLTRRALHMFTNQPEFRSALLRLFMSLYINDSPPKNLVETILVPVSGPVQWVSPLSNPVYWPSEEIAEIYPQGLFIDKQRLPDLIDKEKEWKAFLMAVNVWTAPALYITDGEGKSDIILDMPVVTTPAFEKMIFEYWTKYQSKAETWQLSLPLMGIRSLPSLSNSSFITRLRERPWLSNCSSRLGISCPSQVLVFPEADQYSIQLKPLAKYFTLYFTPVVNHYLLQLTGAILPRNLNYVTAVQLFHWAQAQYPHIPPQEKEFASAWNRLYTLLFEFWRSTKPNDPGRSQIISGLKNSQLLAELPDGNRKKWVWHSGSEVLYVDDQPLLDCLRENEQNQLPPRFTKKDRNEIGIIISKVGVVLSECVTRSLIPPVILREAPFFKYFHWSVAAVAVLEDKMENHIAKDQLAKLADTSTAVSRNLSLSVSVNIGTGAGFVQPTPFFLKPKQQDSFQLLLDETWQHSRKSIAAATQELFEIVTNADYEMLLELQELAGTKTEKEALGILSDLNIDPERVSELKGELGQQEASRRLLFWNTLSGSASLSLAEEESMLPALFAQLAKHYPAVESSFWQTSDEIMRLNDRWTWATLLAARQVFDEAGLDINTLASVFEGKVDSAALNVEQLRIVLQSNRPSFVSALYKYLADKGEKAKSQFLDILKQYDHPGELTDLRGFKFDPVNGFEQHLHYILANMDDQLTYLELKAEAMNEVDLYRANKVELDNRIKEAGLPVSYLHLFLNDNAVKSLLCFGVDGILEGYQNFAFNQDPVTDTGQMEYPPSSNNNPVTSHTPGKPLPGNGGGGNGGGGRNRQSSGQPKSPETQEATGRWGEYYVYTKLLVQFSNLQWVSENAEYYGKTIRGDDYLHYDMKYTDAEGREHYIEVKSTSGAWYRFNISRAQVKFGIDNKNTYHLYFVSYAGNDQRAQAKDLGTIFQQYNSLEDFENSPSIQVEVQDYVVSFV